MTQHVNINIKKEIEAITIEYQSINQLSNFMFLERHIEKDKVSFGEENRRIYFKCIFDLI